MAKISETLVFIKDKQLQQILQALFVDQVIGTPPAATAINAPAGGTGSAAGGWDTAGNRDLAIATINALVADVAALRTQVAKLSKHSN